MSKSIADELMERRAGVIEQATAIAKKGVAHNRDLSTNEQTEFDSLIAEAEQLQERAKAIHEGEERAREVAAQFRSGDAREDVAPVHPLAVSAPSLGTLQTALDGRTASRVLAMDGEQRAALTTATHGSPRAWGANTLGAPRMLHVAAGVAIQRIDAMTAQGPQFTLPTASAAVGENVSLGEYASSTAGTATLGRYGRWTDLSREGRVGTTSESLTRMHTIGIAKDLDKVLIDAVEAAAGAAVAFSADVPAAIRKAMALVIDATAAEDTAELVVLCHPDNAALLQDVSPISGSTIAEGFQRFSGALVYASSAVNTGFITVSNLRAGTRYYEAQALTLETDNDVKTGTQTFASSIIGGYGVGLTGGFASMVDVVTP